MIANARTPAMFRNATFRHIAMIAKFASAKICRRAASPITTFPANMA
jgi:hypothetical protein